MTTLWINLHVSWEIQTRQALILELQDFEKGIAHDVEVHSFTSGGETLHTLSTNAVSASQKDRVYEIVLVSIRERIVW